MSKTRQRWPDGSTVVRTFPVTFLHDVTEERCHVDWHHLTYATRGRLEVITGAARHLVPAQRAVWVPAGVAHVAAMRAPIAMRSLFVAAPAMPGGKVRTLAVSPLLKEVILHVTRLGALDRAQPEQARMAGVVVDLIASAEEVPLDLPLPRDPRARAFAELVSADPGYAGSIALLARRAGASQRTLERCFLAETSLGVGEWRRRVRLFHALHLLDSGTSVTETALEVGYSSVSAFSQAFAKQFGRSPSALRVAK